MDKHLSKRKKQDWQFFIGDGDGRRSYNDLCRRCVFDCKQSSRASVPACKKYKPKR